MWKSVRTLVPAIIVAAIGIATTIAVPGCSSITRYQFINVTSLPLHIKWGKPSDGGYEFEMAPGTGAFCSYYGKTPLVEISTASGLVARLDIEPIFKSHWMNDSICVLPIDQTGKAFDIVDIDKAGTKKGSR